MNIIYEMTEESYSSEGNTRVSYRIAAYADSKDGSTATMIDVIHDITSDKQAMYKLVELCNRLKLSTVHLREVIDDFLAN